MIENARIFRILSGDELLRDEIHAIAHGRDERHLRGAQEAHHRRMGEVSIEISNRGPVRFGEATVQAAGGLLQRLPDLRVREHIRAAQRRDLQERHIALIVREALRGSARTQPNRSGRPFM